MKTVVVEGWRLVPHSYAVVGQALALELARRGDVRVFFRDVPLAFPAWKPEPGLLPAEDEARLRAIPAPPGGAGEGVDAVLRVSWPYYFHRDLDAGETF